MRWMPPPPLSPIAANSSNSQALAPAPREWTSNERRLGALGVILSLALLVFARGAAQGSRPMDGTAASASAANGNANDADYAPDHTIGVVPPSSKRGSAVRRKRKGRGTYQGTSRLARKRADAVELEPLGASSVTEDAVLEDQTQVMSLEHGMVEDGMAEDGVVGDGVEDSVKHGIKDSVVDGVEDGVVDGTEDGVLEDGAEDITEDGTEGAATVEQAQESSAEQGGGAIDKSRGDVVVYTF